MLKQYAVDAASRQIAQILYVATQKGLIAAVCRRIGINIKSENCVHAISFDCLAYIYVRNDQ